jgi:predicted nucleic acid-binding protein
MILVDTGPLVALIHEDDDLHPRCKEVFFPCAILSQPCGLF